MSAGLPAISGVQLIKLLTENDGWSPGRRAKHGRCLTKKFPDRTRVTFVPEGRESLPEGTLIAILSEKQTALHKNGLKRLLGIK